MDARLEMVRELDKALHGEVIARPESPQKVWEKLLAEVERLRLSVGEIAYLRHLVAWEMEEGAYYRMDPKPPIDEHGLLNKLDEAARGKPGLESERSGR
jgi:hypothetical protein